MISFKSIISGSSGNCLLVWSGTTRVMIDCGIHSVKRCKELLAGHLGENFELDSLLVSHTHSDHINYSSLRWAQEYGIEVRVHEKCIHQLAEKHFNGYNFGELRLETFVNAAFTIGDLVITPVELRHEPLHPTYGFVIESVAGGGRIFAATDFTTGTHIDMHMAEADIIFIEANHDLKLLAKHPNYASRFHMPNGRTAEMLFNMRLGRRVAPTAVMLGHLSHQRNTEELAIGAVRGAFENFGKEIDFKLCAAGRYHASEVMVAD